MHTFRCVTLFALALAELAACAGGSPPPPRQPLSTDEIRAHNEAFEGAFINGHNGLQFWGIWNAFGYTEDDPLLELDLLETREGLISSWTIFYEHDFLRSTRKSSSIDEEIVTAYRTARSSGDPGRVASIYAEDAVREDDLYGEHHQGRQSIEDYATNFFSWYPDIHLKLVQPFSERRPGTVKGGVLGFHVRDLSGRPCALIVALLLEPFEEKSKQSVSFMTPNR